MILPSNNIVGRTEGWIARSRPLTPERAITVFKYLAELPHSSGDEGGITRCVAARPSGRCRLSSREGSRPSSSAHKKAPKYGALFYGGEGGIRTLEALRLTHFPGVLLRPLGHLTSKLFFFAFSMT